ncbi:Protein of unknown function [Pyronema omphalodes CBS 100304]|uniref:Uncharacterized protein n=1 Tax=Pyronema omphalodes (strain CBS 100304) TaxID=1076935 RepID=U4L460_PYROM|nr:Protein of unknown function [Pyronema omphalodes CBS 100304]
MKHKKMKACGKSGSYSEMDLSQQSSQARELPGHGTLSPHPRTILHSAGRTPGEIEDAFVKEAPK